MENKAAIEKLYWKDVRKDFARVNPELAHIIDEVDPGRKYPLFKVCYPFGSEILKDGYLQLPDSSGNLLSLYDSRLPNEYRECLNYNLGSNPVGISLKNCTEIFMQSEDRIIPLYGLIQPGKIFGLWRILNPIASHNPTFMWGMSAGGRSLFMLAKISKLAANKRLFRKFDLSIDVPKGILDHWYLFREISSQFIHENFWRAEVLFFSQQWFQSLSDPNWMHFHNYLLQSAWKGSEFWRNEFIWNMVFSTIQKKRNIKPDPYINNSTRQLLNIGIGAVPGFAPAITDEAGPIKNLQDVYANVYNLEYAPIVMQPAMFSTAPHSRPVYYSLEYPTIIEFPQKSRVFSNKITELCNIQYLYNKIHEEIYNGNLNLEDTPYYNLVKTVQYDFYHKEADKHHHIKPSKEMVMRDAAFLEGLPLDASKTFPENSAFLCGCIGISLKNQSDE